MIKDINKQNFYESLLDLKMKIYRKLRTFFIFDTRKE